MPQKSIHETTPRGCLRRLLPLLLVAIVAVPCGRGVARAQKGGETRPGAGQKRHRTLRTKAESESAPNVGRDGRFVPLEAH